MLGVLHDVKDLVQRQQSLGGPAAAPSRQQLRQSRCALGHLRSMMFFEHIIKCSSHMIQIDDSTAPPAPSLSHCRWLLKHSRCFHADVGSFCHDGMSPPGNSAIHAVL